MSERKQAGEIAAKRGKTPANSMAGVPDAATTASRTQINLRLSEDEKAKLKALAKRAGLDVTAYLLATGLHHVGSGGDVSPDFTDRGGGNDSAGTAHEANLKHLMNWTKILEEKGVNAAGLRDTLKLHLQQVAGERLWQQEARKLGRQLVLASKLGADVSVLQEMADAVTKHLRQHLKGRP
jgi:hypothetical protein